MSQTPTELDLNRADPHDGFDIGWDHAHHGLEPPPGQRHHGSPVCQGWQAGKACFGTRTLGASRRVRQWLQLRLHAWLRGRAFALEQVTPHYLGQLEVPLCPITRHSLSGGNASIDRVCDHAGYAAGNLAMMSAEANRAKGALGWQDALVHARQAGAAPDGLFCGLQAGAWSRLAVLMSFVTPLPHAQAVRLPLLVLPPNRLRLPNPVQGLQALVTRELGRPEGARRLRALTELLAGETLRLDFNRFLSALLPRLIEARHDASPWGMRHALEDAWRDARVNRCWQRFALQLDQSQVEALLQPCAAMALSGTRLMLHERAMATQGWALDTSGWVAPQPGAWPQRPVRPAPTGQPGRARITASPMRIPDGHLPA